MGMRLRDETAHSDAWTKACELVAEGIERRNELVGVTGDTHDYSVHLPHMALWEEHLTSLALARASATELIAMGLVDIHIVDDTTGEMIE
jgi:hypothetical protein